MSIQDREINKISKLVNKISDINQNGKKIENIHIRILLI